MSQKANPTLIGAFVFGAILIAIGAVVFFGTANLFSKKQEYVTYFNQSVSGLALGSNVKYKGVTVGKVTKVQLKFQGEDAPPIVKVLFELDAGSLLNNLGVDLDLSNRALNKKMVDRGFRSKLDFESLISGQLFIALDFYKDAQPAVLQDPNANAGPFEIPPQPSDIDAILANLTKAISNLGNVDFLALSKELNSLLADARAAINSMKLDELGPSLTKTSDSISKTSDAFSKLVNGDEIKNTLKSVQGSFEQLTVTLKKLDPAMKNLGPTLEEAKGTLANLQKTTADLSKLLKPDSGFRYQLDGAMTQINSAAESIQRLSDFLQRHPNSILFGRKPDKSDQP
jgi:phospholipid/cholesterol/gamma-HCH transport system substrate-binding protein